MTPCTSSTAGGRKSRRRTKITNVELTRCVRVYRLKILFLFFQDRAGVIPYMDITDQYNPGLLFETYLNVCADEGTIDGREGGYLFSKPKFQSATFHIHDAEEKVLFQPNQKVGKDSVALMLKTLCGVVEQPPCTNHQVRVTAIKNLRRDGWDWYDIAKITGNT